MENPTTTSAAAAAAADATVSASDTATSNTTTNTNSTSTPHFQNSLRSLNKASFKISKPPSKIPNPIPLLPNTNNNPSSIPNPNPNNPQPQTQQPPVYNIDKSNFREIVQKLTGSPSHLHPNPPPPPPPTSRLHRIRPPPLSSVGSTPPPDAWVRPSLSPLPPLPTVSAAAESPITAYMRRLRGGPSPTGMVTAPLPLSPLGFGCSAGLLLPPTSPRMPMPSPR